MYMYFLPFSTFFGGQQVLQIRLEKQPANLTHYPLFSDIDTRFVSFK